MLAVVGGKGGVGKTTTALGLGAAVARRGREVLVVDCDEDMPDCGRLAGIEGGPGADAVAAGTPLRAVTVRPDQFDGMALLTARPGDPIDAMLAALPDRRLTILDAPAGAGPPTAVVLRAATESLIVTTPTREAIEDAIKTAETARSLAAPPLGLLVTMAEGVPSGLERATGLPVVGLIPGGGPSPLTVDTVQAAYDRLASRLQGNV